MQCLFVQLKVLFKEKQNLANAYRKIPQDEKPADDWTEKSRLVKVIYMQTDVHLI